jgi:hypothetical protein
MRVELPDDDWDYIKLVLYGTRRGREIAEKIPNPSQKKIITKKKTSIDPGHKPIRPRAKKPYRTPPDYPPRTI